MQSGSVLFLPTVQIASVTCTVALHQFRTNKTRAPPLQYYSVFCSLGCATLFLIRSVFIKLTLHARLVTVVISILIFNEFGHVNPLGEKFKVCAKI